MQKLRPTSDRTRPTSVGLGLFRLCLAAIGKQLAQIDSQHRPKLASPCRLQHDRHVVSASPPVLCLYSSPPVHLVLTVVRRLILLCLPARLVRNIIVCLSIRFPSSGWLPLVAPLCHFISALPCSASQSVPPHSRLLAFTFSRSIFRCCFVVLLPCSSVSRAVRPCVATPEGRCFAGFVVGTRPTWSSTRP